MRSIFFRSVTRSFRLEQSSPFVWIDNLTIGGRWKISGEVFLMRCIFPINRTLFQVERRPKIVFFGSYQVDSIGNPSNLYNSHTSQVIRELCATWYWVFSWMSICWGSCYLTACWTNQYLPFSIRFFYSLFFYSNPRRWPRWIFFLSLKNGKSNTRNAFPHEV